MRMFEVTSLVRSKQSAVQVVSAQFYFDAYSTYVCNATTVRLTKDFVVRINFSFPFYLPHLFVTHTQLISFEFFP